MEQMDPSELEEAAEGERRKVVSSSRLEASVTTALSGLVTSESSTSLGQSEPLWSLMMNDGRSCLAPTPTAPDPRLGLVGEDGLSVSTTVSYTHLTLPTSDLV